MVKIDLNELENEKQVVIYIYKKQLTLLQSLKKDVEKVEWSDINYDRTVDALNNIIEELCNGVQILSNGKNVYIIDELIELANDYIKCGKNFP